MGSGDRRRGHARRSLALKLLVSRLLRSERVAAVAGAPHVTNRRNLLCAMQVIEASAIIGLIRRTQAVAGRVGVVAGVLGLFRRDVVVEAGGYRAEMATEDIELTYRLLLAGWHTTFEPDALVGMQVPSNLRALWAQRRRWARGQGGSPACPPAPSGALAPAASVSVGARGARLAVLDPAARDLVPGHGPAVRRRRSRRPGRLGAHAPVLVGDRRRRRRHDPGHDRPESRPALRRPRPPSSCSSPRSIRSRIGC